MNTKIENLKKLISEMDSKKTFVEQVEKNYDVSYIYIMQVWFQKEWKIPINKIDEIIAMAQKYLFNQTTRSRNLLKETGYDNN